MSEMLKKGDKVVLIECPPAWYSFDDYISSFCFLVGWMDDQHYLIVLQDRRGPTRVVNMRADTVIEIRQPFEGEWV